MDFETLSLDRAGAAAVVGLTEAQISNWVTKYGLFPEKRQGKGAHFFFLFRDVLTLASIKALTDGGVAAPDAVMAIRPYSSYSCLLGNGVLALSHHNGRWVAIDGPDLKLSLQVRMWPVFDGVFSRFCEALQGYAKVAPADQIDEAIHRYRSEIQELRARRHAEASTKIAG